MAEQLPSYWLSNKREAELADKIWVISKDLPGRYELQLSHELFANAEWPWMNKRIIYARDWITKYREMDGRGGSISVNRQLGGTDYTAEEIGNVEHFYVAALLGTIGGPAGGVMLNVISGVAWEMIVGPARTAVAHGSWAVVWKNMKHNFNQLTNANWAGTKFGSFYKINEDVAKLIAEPAPAGVKPSPTPAPGPAPKAGGRQHKVAPGDWLSKLAERYYLDKFLWPLIFDANRGVVTDPNKIAPGQILSIPDLATFNKGQIEAARARGRQWRSAA